MAYENNDKRQESVFSSRIKAGKRRTYFFDVKATKANDYFLTITESRKRFNEDGYDRSKLFLYKEDFNKFIKGLNEAVDYVKTELMPDFDFDAFNHEYPDSESYEHTQAKVIDINENAVLEVPEKEKIAVNMEASSSVNTAPSHPNSIVEEVDKW